MPGPLAPLMTKVAGLGTVAKASVAATTVAVAIALGTAGAVAVVGGTSGAAEVADSALQAVPPGDGTSPTTSTAGPTTTVAGSASGAGTATSGTPTTRRAATAGKKTQPATPATTVAPPSPAAATPTAPARTPLVPTGVARRTPPDAEVQQALETFPQYVKTFIRPTAAQVAELGGRVCTAFDGGQTFAQVKATGLAMVTQVPRTTVLPGGADWVVRTIVKLYCPGHAPKLV